jgi:hypothetical protein
VVIPRICFVCFYHFFSLSYFSFLRQLGIRANFDPHAAQTQTTTNPVIFSNKTHPPSLNQPQSNIYLTQAITKTSQKKKTLSHHRVLHKQKTLKIAMQSSINQTENLQNSQAIINNTHPATIDNPNNPRHCQ